MQELLAQIDADNRRVVAHQTFGHLYPDDTDVHTGRICASIGCFGDVVVLDEDVEGIKDSPWWKGSMDEFIYQALREEPEGSVWVLSVEAQVVFENKTVSQIIITEKSRRCIKKQWSK